MNNTEEALAKADRAVNKFFSYVGGIIILSVFLAWVFDYGVFGWFDGPTDAEIAAEAAAEEARGPKVLVSRENGTFCTQKRYAEQAYRAATVSDYDTISSLLVAGHCKPMEADKPVRRISGLTIQNVNYNGEEGWTTSSSTTMKYLSEVQR